MTDDAWLRREISLAAREAERWPTWMQDPRLWHDILGREGHISATNDPQSQSDGDE